MTDSQSYPVSVDECRRLIKRIDDLLHESDSVEAHKELHELAHLFEQVVGVAQGARYLPSESDLVACMDDNWGLITAGLSRHDFFAAAAVAIQELIRRRTSLVPSTQNSPPVFKATQNSAESDPSATPDCAGGETVSSTNHSGEA